MPDHYPTTTQPRLLLIEDDPDAAALMRETLEDHFGPGCIRHCPTLAQSLAVDLYQIDLVLSDMNLPDGCGLDVLGKFLEQRPDLPLVFVTGEGILDNAILAIRRGAYDYVVKAGEYLFTLPVIVEKNLELWRIKRENQSLADQLEQMLDQVRVKNHQLEEMVTKLETMAATDPLTGLANRRAFAQAMDRRFADAVRQGHDLACVMIDLDGFKQLNDTLGHPTGDRVLQTAARVLQANCRRSDVAGRFGGDEFVLVLPQIDEEAACQVVRRIGEEFETATSTELAQAGFDGRLSMSMGLSMLEPHRVTSPEQLIAQADHALYCAKSAGKTRLVVHRPANADVAESRVA